MVLIINAALLGVVFLCMGYILHLPQVMQITGRGDEEFTYREVALCILLVALANGIIDYFLIVKPLWDLEEVVYAYEENTSQYAAHISERRVRGDSVGEVIKRIIESRRFEYEKRKLEERQRKRSELDVLQSQIDPHFLYNALDSIRGYALIHDMETISNITEALSRVFRNMISDKHEYLLLRQEIDNIKNYMLVQQFRFNNKFDYSFEIDEALVDNYYIPRMVLQPLVENAIQHGLEQKTEGGWLKIRAFATEERLVVTVIDNGSGISEERLNLLEHSLKANPYDYNLNEEKEHLGIALVNINRRIKINFGSQYGIVLRSTPNVRTESEITLPLLLNKR